MPSSRKHPAATPGRFRRVGRRLALTLAGLIALLGIYGAAIEPRLILDTERIRAQLPGLGPSWTGAEVALLSDLQVGMWWANEGMVARAVREIVDADPDLVLLGGDYVYSGDPAIPVQVNTVLELLAPLTDSGIPTYAVMGNHDHGSGAAHLLTTAFEERGITVLRNEAVAVPAPQARHPGDELYIVGVGPTLPGLAHTAQAVAGVPQDAPRVVLLHNPTSFPYLPVGSAPLALAGHTHCGQIALPGAPHWSYIALTQEEATVAEGFAAPKYGKLGNSLFVNCGIGFSVIPVRINAPPQVVFVTLEPR